MPFSNICEINLPAAIRLKWNIILGKFFISEYISTSTPAYLKMKKFHDIRFLGVFDSYRNWLLKKVLFNKKLQPCQRKVSKHFKYASNISALRGTWPINFKDNYKTIQINKHQ